MTRTTTIKLTNRDIIKAIALELETKIPLSKGHQDFSPSRLIHHCHYWISLANEENGKFSQAFLKRWTGYENKLETLTEAYGVNLETYFTKAEIKDYDKTELGI